MSKCIKGEYGTFEASDIRKAVKEHCNRKNIAQKEFFKDHLHMTDHQIINELGAERVRSLYYLAMYELSKQTLQKK